MRNASQVQMREVDKSFVTQGVSTGVSGFIGKFSRGPINDASILITSVEELRRVYGSKNGPTNDLLLAERALAGGGALRIVNVASYTTPADPSSITATYASSIDIANAADAPLATLKPKYQGAGYNGLTAIITAGVAGTFDLVLFIAGEEAYTREEYRGLKPEKTTVNDSNWLRAVVDSSQLVNVEYKDLTAVADVVAAPETVVSSGGTNGTALTNAAYTGDAGARTGLHALSPFTDMLDFAIPAITDPVVNNAAASYAASRGDIEALLALPNTANTATAIITARQAITVDSKYYSVWAGGVKVYNPDNGQIINLTSTADVIAAGHRADDNYGPYFSLASDKRSEVLNALGVVNNFGTPADYTNLNQLARAGVNVIAAIGNGTIRVRGNYSGQSAGNSKAAYRNIVRGLIYIKKSIRPTIERYLDEPADFETFKNLANEIKPFLATLEDNRAVYPGGAVWEGDQLASKMSELKVNTAAALSLGKYKAKLYLNFIGAINTIELDISIEESSFVMNENI